jgi:nonsense-mediated mRNA decay protein 3
VARSTDLGVNDTQYFCRTHLGHILHPGDTALGYFVASANFNDDDVKSFKFNKNHMPDVILVRKVYPASKKKRSNRVWRVKHLRKDEDMRTHEADRARRDFDEFLDDVERDPETRAQINLYKGAAGVSLARSHDLLSTDRKAHHRIQQMIDSKNQMSDVGDAPAEGEEEEADPNDVRLEELLEDLSLADSQSVLGDEDIEDDSNFVDPSEL